MLFLLPILSAALLLAAFPPLELSWCVYIAIIPLLVFIDRAKNTRTICIGAGVTGFLYGIFTLFPLASTNAWWWLEQSSLLFQHKELALYGFLALLALIGDVPFFILFSLAYKRIFAKDSPIRHWFVQILFVAACWTILEYARSFVPGGIAWQELGISLAPQEYIRQFAHLVGIYGLGFFAVAMNICLYRWSLEWRRPRHFMASLLAFLAIWSYGYYRINAEPLGDPVRVAAIHSTLTTQEESVGLVGFRYYEKAVETALAAGANLVVLPENAVSFVVIDENTMLPLGYELPSSTIKAVYDKILGWSTAHPKKVFLIGLHSKKDEHLFNSVAYIEAGQLRQLYHKRHLLPLSEGDFSSASVGGGQVDSFVFETGLGRISPLICSEVLYSDATSRRASADLVTISGNDAIFGSDIVARRGRQVTLLRAVQSGKYFIVSTKGLESAIIDPLGEFINTSTDPSVVMADIRIRR
ncbi:MAG: nitrilase-related carbon-nitrogen hydrolase [Patescibacteria group bacterium]